VSPPSHFLSNKLSLKKWMDSDYDVVSTMKEEIKALREVFGKRVSQGLLEQIENRFIIFMVDGSDIQQILDTHDDFMPAIDGKKQYPSKVNVNINRYIAKYNFEIARKIRGDNLDVIPQTGSQKLFNRFAMLELLHDVSGLLNGGKVYFNRLSLIDGTVVDNDITKIPEDTKILLVSKCEDDQEIGGRVRTVKIQEP
jgi:hypothetical protein